MLDQPPSIFDPAAAQTALELAAPLVTCTSVEALLQGLPARLAAVIRCDAIALGLVGDGDALITRYLIDADAAHPIARTTEPPLNDRLQPSPWATRRPLLLDPPWANLLFDQFRPGRGSVACCCVLPLTAGNRDLGAIAIASVMPNAYTDHDLLRLKPVATMLAAAIDVVGRRERSALSAQRVAFERDRCRLLLEINNAVVTNLDFSTLLRAVSACVRRAVVHDAASLALHEPERHRFRVVALDDHAQQMLLGSDLFVPETGTRFGRVLETAQAVIRHRIDVAEFPADPWVARIVESGIVSSCSVPLLSRGRSVGVLSLGGRTAAMFTDADADLLHQVGRQLAIAVENAIAVGRIEELTHRLAHEKRYLEDEIRSVADFSEIVGGSPALQDVLCQVELVAATDSSVLIQGETGTGKELIARAIHRLSPRHERTLVKVNCAAVPAGLLESELFGHEKGAFTGALSRRIGRFELAEGGTLFLDEVSETSRELQAKLLRVLQEKEFERVGGATTIRSDVRIIAATNANLAGLLATGAFRTDLYYRLNVFPITMPPLRDREGDILLLARWFTRKHARRMKKPIDGLSARAEASLVEYDWPGNVRELENVIERGVILAQGTVLDLPRDALNTCLPVSASAGASLSNIERAHILRVLIESGWVIAGPRGAAARLGMKRSTLQSRMIRLGITRPQ